MSDEQHNVSDDKEYCLDLLCRCSELEVLVLGEEVPDRDKAMLYFKYHEMLHKTFKMGEDLSMHPRNPWNPNCLAYGAYDKKRLDIKPKPVILSKTMNEKDEKLIKFLEETIAALEKRVMTSRDPLMTDRMTFFAYANFLRHKFHKGFDYTNHPRNPWQGVSTPMDFNDYSQIRQLPKELSNDKTEFAKTQVIPTLKTPFLPNVEIMHRVFDKTVKGRTVYQGTEAKCYIYVKKANIDCGAELFDYEATSVTNFTPKEGSSHIRTAAISSCCPVTLPPRKQTPKELVAEYLKRTALKTENANEPTTTNA